MLNKKIALLGCGFMARAIASGLIKNGVVEAGNITAINSHNPDSAKRFAAELRTLSGGAESVSGADVVIIAFKPQSFGAAMPVYAAHIAPRTLVVSIMAGIRISDIEAALPAGTPVIRAMPNLALSVQLGAVGYACGKSAGSAESSLFAELFSALGVVRELGEDGISGVTAVSGSGGAYFYYLAECMEAAAVEAGMERKTAEALVKQTFIGFAELWARENQPASEMRRRITSAKGTTDAAIRKMQELDFSGIVSKAMEACRARSDELAEEMSGAK
jgi:pyrroline-5-carboxylate reductase